jgi:hypothetical protein
LETRVTKEMNEKKLKEFIVEEIATNLSRMQPLKA